MIPNYSKRIVGASLLLIVYFTLFPFDFFFDNAPSLPELIQNFDLNLTRTYAIADYPPNLLLFVPFGFGLAAITFTSVGRKFWAFFLITFAGLWVSLLVETLQTYTLQRVPALGDLLANSAGTAVGALIFLLFGPKILNTLEQSITRLSNYFTIRTLAVAFLLYAAAWFALSLLIQNQTRLANWDPNYPLLIANEQTGNRRFQGTIQQIFILPAALPQQEIAALFESGFSAVSQYPDLLAHYTFPDPTDQNFPPLDSRGSKPLQQTPQGAAFTGSQWLQSQTTAQQISQQLEQSNQFTIAITAASTNLNQNGPTRLLSISEDALSRNLTIGQEYQDLVLRLRTPLTGLNGRLPELVFPNIFIDEAPHQLIITYNGSTATLYKDHPQNQVQIQLLPAIAIFTKFFPYDIQRLRLNQGSRLIFTLLYRTLVFVPLGLLLNRWRKTHHGRTRTTMLLTIILAAVTWELLLAIGLPTYQLRLDLIGINGLTTAVAAALQHQNTKQ